MNDILITITYVLIMLLMILLIVDTIWRMIKTHKEDKRFEEDLKRMRQSAKKTDDFIDEYLKGLKESKKELTTDESIKPNVGDWATVIKQVNFADLGFNIGDKVKITEINKDTPFPYEIKKYNELGSVEVIGYVARDQLRLKKEDK